MKWSDKPAGCWRTAALILVALALLDCGIIEGVRKFAEPVDTAGCRLDCKRAGLEFGSYEYRPHRCLCLNADGGEVELYGMDWGER